MEKKITIKPRPPLFLLNNDNPEQKENNYNSTNNTTTRTTTTRTTTRTNTTVNKNWERIKKLVDNIRKNKNILIIIIEFLSKFKIYITKQITINNNNNDVQLGSFGINKLEYFNIVELIETLANKINNLRTILNKKNIFFFDIVWCQTNINNLTELYIQTLYLIEKYGGINMLYAVNSYLLIYSGLQDIYFIWDNEYCHNLGPVISKYKNTSSKNLIIPATSESSYKARQKSFQNEQIFNSRINSTANGSAESSDDENNTSEDEIKLEDKLSNKTPHVINNAELFLNKSFQSSFSKINNIYSTVIFNNQLGIKNNLATYNINSPVILYKFIGGLSPAEYANVLNMISIPIQMTAFFITNNTPCDLYNSLSIFHSIDIVPNKQLFNTNPIVSDIYRDLALHSIGNHDNNSSIFENKEQYTNIWISDINNPMIYATIPNFDKIKDLAVHIFIRIKTNKTNDECLLFIITAILTSENTIILNNYPFLDKRIKYITANILQDLDDISVSFRNNLVKILTLKQLLTATTPQITAWCYDKWNLYNTIIKMNVLEMMNYFLAQSLSRKTEILTVLLLHSNHADSTFRAYILWDLLIDENSPLIEKEIFTNLHTSIQTKLRNTIDTYIGPLLNTNNGNTYETQLGSGNTTNKLDELSYEKRILLLKTDDTVKNKAHEKLREINNKTTENSSKPQQYLDGLLSIPFGTVAKEWIISNSEVILEKSKVIIINFICLCYDYRDIYSWARTSLEWAATNLGLPGLTQFIKGLSSNQPSPSSRSNTGNPGFQTQSLGTSILDGIGPQANSAARNKSPSKSSPTLDNNIINYYQSIENETLCKINSDLSLLLENYLDRAFDISNCGIICIRKLNTFLEQHILAKRVLVSIDSLEAQVLIEALNSLDITQLQDIQYELKQDGFSVNINDNDIQPSLLKNRDIINSHSSSEDTNYTAKNHKKKNKIYNGPNIKSLEIINNYTARKIIVEYLINEGYFYDIGYPTDLMRFTKRLDELISNHNGHRLDKQKFIQNSRKQLDTSIYGQSDAKEQIIRIIAQWINGNQEGYCLGFEGSPGLGKTSLAKYGISQALVDANGKSRPFGFIALGGSANGSILEGHSYTYVGSTWGRIVDILIQSRCMNPIIFIDELDKISHTESGRELIGILTHLTDHTQNNEFTDKYFAGVKLDLSKVLFIFSYNDYSLLDPILADRIHRVRFENYTISDKVAISRDYLIPRIAAEINMSLPVSLDAATIEYIINSYTYEAGVRKLKEKYYDIFRELNVRDICGGLETYELSAVDNSLALTTELIDSILATQHKIEIDRPLAAPRVGVVYGLYATGLGIGGLTIIQVSRKLADHGGILLCTGKQGDVMMESMKVALTLACGLVPLFVLEKWGLIPSLSESTSRTTNNNDTSNELNKNKLGIPSIITQTTNPKWSFHIHVPDGATSKDGPSAGCAITLGLVSLLMDLPVRNDISMTGEIDMLGHVLPIGGLDAKITGSRIAGIREILVPRRNHQDLTRIQTRTPEICAGLTIHLVDTIQEVLAHGLVGGLPENTLKSC